MGWGRKGTSREEKECRGLREEGRKEGKEGECSVGQ